MAQWNEVFDYKLEKINIFIYNPSDVDTFALYQSLTVLSIKDIIYFMKMYFKTLWNNEIEVNSLSYIITEF